ncbi:MAG: peptide chain release factor 2 [Bdellovibrionales bacterium]|nr:peptide chain release factor 2 [Bdellovibrionales bacterium]
MGRMSQAEDFWSDADKAKEVSQERSEHQAAIDSFKNLSNLYDDAEAALELAAEEGESEFLEEADATLDSLDAALGKEEFLCKMSGEHDKASAILEINGGSGGTEAQDWAEMLMRMYLRWIERKGMKVEELDYRAGEEAGIKSVTLYVQAPYAYGYLRAEQGVHRLVRISPFDSNARRHTSFASVAVTPDIEEEIDFELEDKDLRIDTFRASGAGGQHVNKTDSAVRITHIPTGVVVSCQNERSQHKNKDRAMKVLKAKLFELERQKQAEKMDAIKGERKAIDFGSQIRSYVMHPYKMVKDLRTQYETSAVDAVLDGDLDDFIEAYLLAHDA